ncbi:hypothetical protein [Petrimonas sulfuriphila]|uniref:hypothetical protein n=1 Tax=Petrimonas sulfuriphila TaxID=285070 RepID=UPI003EC0E280
MLRKGTFNTINQSSTQIGGGKVVWSRVRELYQGGGKIDHTKYPAGTVIPAGTMVKFNGAGAEVNVITAEGQAGRAEIDTLTVTAKATASGNLTVTLDGTVAVTVAVLDTDDTPEKVAAKIAAGTYTGWTAEADGAVVTFTADDEEAKAAPAFAAAATGVTATFAVTVAGVDPDGSALTDVNGLIFEDVYMPEGTIHATCAVVRAGRIYADRVAGGGLPTAIESQLPMIEFVRES